MMPKKRKFANTKKYYVAFVNTIVDEPVIYEIEASRPSQAAALVIEGEEEEFVGVYDTYEDAHNSIQEKRRKQEEILQKRKNIIRELNWESPPKLASPYDMDSDEDWWYVGVVARGSDYGFYPAVYKTMAADSAMAVQRVRYSRRIVAVVPEAYREYEMAYIAAEDLRNNGR